MKKIYLLFALLAALLTATSVDAQKYKLVEQATAEPVPGTTYAIMNAELSTYISCKVGSETGGLIATLIDDDVLWQIEDTGEKTPAGFQLYYIKSVSQDAYIQEVDLEGHPGYDGYDVFNYQGFNFNLGTKEHAAKVTIARGQGGSDTAEGERWRTVGPSTGFVIARQDSVVRSGEATWFFKFGVQGHNVAFEPYNESVGWQFWTVAENDTKQKLKEYIDLYSQTEYLAGTDPGYYDQSVVDAYNASLQSGLALTLNDDATEQQCQDALADLQAKRDSVQNAVVPITDGYYYLVSGFDDFLNNVGVEKAAYANPSAGLLYYKTFDPDNVEFVFHITRNIFGDAQENEFWVQSYATDLYASCGTQWYSSPNALVSTQTVPQTFRYYCPAKFYWANRRFPRTSVTPYASSSPQASDSEGALTSWGQWGDESTVNTHFNLWYLRRVSEDKMSDFAVQKAQYERTSQIEDLAKEGRDLYANLFTYIAGTEPLITTAGGSWAFDTGGENSNIEGNQIIFSHIRTQSVEFADDYKFLIDEHDSTYMQGSGYIQVDLSSHPVRLVTIEYDARCSSGLHGTANQHLWGTQEKPNRVEVYATNDTTDASSWKLAATADMGNLPVPAQISLDLGDTYSFVRYNVISNATGNAFFTISKFQIYEATVDQTTSQYYTVNGMKAAADTLMSTISAKVAGEATASETDIEELRNAIAAVRALYADTAALATLAVECDLLASTAVVGEGVGQIASQSTADALASAVAAAKAVITPSATVAQVSTALASLQQARTAFLSAIKPFQAGKFYYITSVDSGLPETLQGSPIYMVLPNHNNVAMAGYYRDEYYTYPEFIWRFIPTDRGTYYIQNLASGQYMPEFDGARSDAYVMNTPSEYEITYSGYGAYTLVSKSEFNTQNLALAIYRNSGNPTTVLQFNPEEKGGNTSWAISEVSSDVDAITNDRRIYSNSMDILMLPYDLSMISDLNDSLHIYGIRKMTQELNEDSVLVTTIDFYEKQSAAANEPVFYVHGTPGQGEYEEIEVTIPMPSDLTDTPVPANGLVGVLTNTTFEPGVAYSSGTELHALTSSASIGYRTGVIDPAYYTGEIDSVETALTLTVTGLKAIPVSHGADVNNDGVINSSDVVAVYNYINQGDASGYTLVQADVNGDKMVNSSDAVEIYNQIAGTSASKGFSTLLKLK